MMDALMNDMNDGRYVVDLEAGEESPPNDTLKATSPCILDTQDLPLIVEKIRGQPVELGWMSTGVNQNFVIVTVANS
jgi:hypothetical protein